jgi:hypothetical protein
MVDQRSIWIDFCKEYCNNDFDGVEDDNLPLTVLKAVDKLLLSEANRVSGVKSKTSEGLIVESYTAETIPMDIRTMLNPYRKMRW